MSTYLNGIYGLVIILLLTWIITIGFIYELGSGALHIESRQYSTTTNFSHNPGSILNNSSYSPYFVY